MKKYKRPDVGGFSSELGVCYTNEYYYVASYYDKDDDKIKTIVKLNIDSARKSIKIKLFDEYYTIKDKLIKLILVLLIYAFLIGTTLLIAIPIQRLLRSLGIFYIFYLIIIVALFGFFNSVLASYLREGNVIEKGKYHGAEHKTFNAYEKFGESFSIKKVKQASRFHPRCGVSIFSNFLFSYIICYIISLAFNTYMIPIYFVFSFSYLLRRVDIISYVVQKVITTKEPDLIHMQVAITAFNRLIELENGDDIKDEEEVAARKRSIYLRKLKDESSSEMSDDEFADALDDTAEQIEKQSVIENIIFPPKQF